MKRLIVDAKAGNAMSQFNLGVIYDNGMDDNGYPTADTRADAIFWLSRAAQQGLPRAQCKLAELLADDLDAVQNHSQACTWFLLAMQSSSGTHRRRAESGYQRLALRMNAEQIAHAAHLAQIWKPRRKLPVTAARLPGRAKDKEPADAGLLRFAALRSSPPNAVRRRSDVRGSRTKPAAVTTS